MQPFQHGLVAERSNVWRPLDCQPRCSPRSRPGGRARSGSRLAPLDRAELRLEVTLELVVADHAAGVDVSEPRFDVADELLALLVRRNHVLGDAISDHSTKDDEIVFDMVIVVPLENGSELVDGDDALVVGQHADRTKAL